MLARKKQKISDTTHSSESLNEFASIPDSQLFFDLLKLERQIDLLKQKQSAHAISINSTTKAKLQIRIYNTFSNQGATYHTDANSKISLLESPNWTLRIEGVVLDEKYKNILKFTDCISKFVVEFDRKLYPQNGFIEWHQSSQLKATSGFEFRRAGNQEIDAKIHLVLNSSQFKVDDRLAKILNKPTPFHSTSSQLCHLFLLYCQTRKLLNIDNVKVIRLDESLRKLFDLKELQVSDILKHLNQFLQPRDHLEYTYGIKLSGNPQDQIHVVDVDVPTLLISEKENKDLNSIDNEINSKIEKFNILKRRREMLCDFIEEPVDRLNESVVQFISDSNVSQSGGIEINEEEAKSSLFYYHPYASEAVNHFVRNVVTHQISEQENKQ